MEPKPDVSAACLFDGMAEIDLVLACLFWTVSSCLDTISAGTDASVTSGACGRRPFGRFKASPLAVSSAARKQ